MKPAPLDTDRLVGDRYILESLIAKGGMGEVWRARHQALKSLVAIKFLHRASAFSASKRKRFLTEAQVTANLKTRHAVQVFDFGVTEDGLPYLVMEFLEGETLEKRIAREGRLSIETTFMVLRQAARALDRAHALGIVHRDFKPANIIILADEEGGESVKVVDFGIAKLVGDLELFEPLPPASSGSPGDAGVSVTNTAVGTPYYMAPEQIQDTSRLGPATDIWAFGIVAYECLTGRRPFDDESVPRLLSRIIDGAVPLPASMRAPVPRMFDDWFQVACARDPEERFPDASVAVSAMAIALDMPAVPATISRTSVPGAAPLPKRVVSPLAATLDARTSARPPSPSSGEIGPATPLPTPLLPPPDRESAPPSSAAFEPAVPSSAAFGILPPPPSDLAANLTVLPLPVAASEPAARPFKAATDAPIEPAPRLSRAGRPSRTPMGVIFLGCIVALALTTVAIERQSSAPVPARGSSSVASAALVILAPPTANTQASGKDDPAPPPVAAPTASAETGPVAPAALALATASAGSPRGAASSLEAPRRKPASRNVAPETSARGVFRLPPLGL